MATLQELYSLNADGDLLQKVTAAIVISAYAISQEDPGTASHAERLVWAKASLMTPEQKAQEMLFFLLGANSANTLSQIQNATDTAIQSAVDGAVNFFAV